MQGECRTSSLLERYAEPQPILLKDTANESLCLFLRSHKTIVVASLKLSGLIAIDIEVRVMVVLVLWHYNLFERCAANEHRCVYFGSGAEVRG